MTDLTEQWKKGEDADKHFSSLNEEISDESGVWFDIQRRELEEGNNDRD